MVGSIRRYGAVCAMAIAGVACGSTRGGFGEENGGATPAPTGSFGGEGEPGPGSLGDGGTASSDAACAASVVSALRAEVDIIVVIDTSGSMDEETAQVKANINTFAQSI